MKEATILDLGEIADIMSAYEGRDCYEYVGHTLREPTFHWFFSERLNSAVLYVPEDNDRYQIHIYGTGTGSSLAKFSIKTGAYMLDLGARTLINWVREDQLQLRLFMRMIKAHRVANVNGEILYAHTQDDRERMMEVI